MPFKAGNPMPVTVTTTPALSGPAQPVYVVDAPPAVAGRAQRVVAVAGGPIKNGAAIPVYNAGADALFTDDPPLPVYVMSGSLGDAAPATLLNDLVAYWKLDEASGARADSAGANTLTDNNTVLGATGKIGLGALFAAATTEYLSSADNAALSMGDFDFTIGLWFNATTSLTQRTLIAKGDGNTSNATEYALYLTVGSLQFDVMNGSATGSIASAALSLSTWYYALAWYDATANTVNLKINNVAVTPVSYGGGSYDSTHPFNIGRWPVFNLWYYDGIIDEVGIWKRKLTDAEQTALYNSGNGRSWPFVGA